MHRSSLYGGTLVIEKILKTFLLNKLVAKEPRRVFTFRNSNFLGVKDMLWWISVLFLLYRMCVLIPKPKMGGSQKNFN